MSNPIHHDAAAGRSALLLVESLIHTLVERSVLTLEEAVEIVETAADIDRDSYVRVDGEAVPISLLTPIAESLKIDLNARR